MTACVNKHSKRVAAVISASLVGALSLGVAVPAFAAEGDIDLQSEQTTPVWKGVDLTWNVEADRFGNYTVQAGDQFMLTGAKDAFGTSIPMSDLTVLIADGTQTSIQGGDLGDVVHTYTPSKPGKYTAFVFNGAYKLRDDWTPNTPLWQSDADALNAMQFVAVPFTVEAKSLEGSFAYEGDDVADTNFKYTGYNKVVNFADASQNKLVAGVDYTITSVRETSGTSVSGINSINHAGTYVVTIEGAAGSDYEGSTATVTFKVAPIDFDNDVFTVKTIQQGFTFTSGELVDTSVVMVNGEPLADDAVKAFAVSVARADGVAANPTAYLGNTPAKVVLSIEAGAGMNWSPDNYKGDSATAEMKVVGQLVGNFYYDNNLLSTTDSDGNYLLTVDASKGDSFDPALVSAALTNGGNSLPVDVTVYRNGEKTEDYSTPGTLTVSVDVATPSDLSYGGSATIKVTIKGKHYAAEPMVFAAIDGKNADGSKIEYDGEAVEPVVVAKSGSATIDSADYTVTYTDADGEAVEEIVEPGEYTGTVDFGNATWGINGDTDNKVDVVTFTFEVTKATIHSAKADKDVYAETGEAVTPIFTAWTGEDLDGLSVEIDPAEVGVAYYKAVEKTDYNNWLDPTDDVKYWEKDGDPIKASDLKKAGNYIAVVTVPADDPHFTGEVESEMFEISSYAVYSDVAADAWYADSVYNAAELGYMTGIKGTKLFMPEASISRAELSQVFFNMAGNASDTEKFYPTAFSDVDGWAWYAPPVAWASEAGIVTGYDSSTFAPMDKATREQVAVMLYRYAKGQGKDVTVENADETLAAYKDADQVADWAKDAMAWAVENGIFGVDTDELWAKQDIQRAAVATIAVRFQPEALPEA